LLKQPGLPCRQIPVNTLLRKNREEENSMNVVNVVEIDFERCKECGYCIAFCPKKALAKGTALNRKGYFPPVWTAGECIGCGTCGRVCPDAAITVYREE